MRKICMNCMNVFEPNTPLEMCPLVGCADGYLIEIDDFLVDIIKKLWEMGISTKYCCAGHLEETCFNLYIMFDGAYNDYFEMDLSHFRNVLIEVNAGKDLVKIEEIVEKDDFDTFVVSGLCESSETDLRKKLKCQMDFAEFFYDVIDHIDICMEEAEL